MKRWMALLGGALCYMLLALPVRADVIWEPPDSFYEEHDSECEYVARTYTANGPDGEVILYESPVSDRVVARWENGHRAYISFSYQDKNGVVWGVCEEGGWVPMAYMDVVYDAISFAEEYQADIVEQEGALDGQYQGENVFFWDYPGASEGYEVKVEDYVPEYRSAYVDSQGRTWGNVSYYFGHKNFWICLDQPKADYDTLYPGGGSGIGQAQPAEKDYSEERIVPDGRKKSTVWIVLAMVVAVTGMTLMMLGKETKK